MLLYFEPFSYWNIFQNFGDWYMINDLTSIIWISILYGAPIMEGQMKPWDQISVNYSCGLDWVNDLMRLIFFFWMIKQSWRIHTACQTHNHGVSTKQLGCQQYIWWLLPFFFFFGFPFLLRWIICIYIYIYI